MTAAEQKSELLKRMFASSRCGAVRKVIPFKNNDVPRFLKKLDRFEARSAKARLLVR